MPRPAFMDPLRAVSLCLYQSISLLLSSRMSVRQPRQRGPKAPSQRTGGLSEAHQLTNPHPLSSAPNKHAADWEQLKMALEARSFANFFGREQSPAKISKISRNIVMLETTLRTRSLQEATFGSSQSKKSGGLCFSICNFREWIQQARTPQWFQACTINGLRKRRSQWTHVCEHWGISLRSSDLQVLEFTQCYAHTDTPSHMLSIM